jgi:hypothetical protein
MAISPVSSNVRNVPDVQPPAQPVPDKEVKNDTKKDEVPSKVAAPPDPRPTVNTKGQAIGSTINTQA